MYNILIVVKKIKYLYKHCMTKRGEFVANVNDLLRSFHFNKIIMSGNYKCIVAG